MLEPNWIGRRVSVRRAVDRAADGRLAFADVVGDLVGLDSQTAVVDTRSGLVEVTLAHVAAARRVPPSTADELALEAVAAQGIRPAETEWLDGWLLRADHGSPRRANSVLPLRQLRRPLDEAISAAHDWYAARGLPLLIATMPEARRLLDAGLAERGWPVAAEAHVLTARLDRLRPEPADDARVTLAARPDDAWFSVYRGGAVESAPGRELWARHEDIAFATLVEDGRTVAVGRAVVDAGWLGVSGVEVAPDARRRGLATAVMRALWAWGGRRGAVRSYLQVEADNAGAITLYERLGYVGHHDYRYRVEPG